MNNLFQSNGATSLFQDLLRSKIRFSTVFISSFIFYISCIWLGYWIYGNSPIADTITVLLSSLLGLIMVTALWVSRGKSSFDLLAVLSLFMCLFFFPRLIQYVTFRQEDLKLFYISFPIHWTADDLNKGLAYLVLGTLVIVIGFFGAEKLFYKCSRHTINDQPLGSGISTKLPSLLSIILAGVIIYGVDGYYTIYLGLSASSNCDIEGIPYRWLIHFFSGDTYIFAVIALLGLQLRGLDFKYKLLLCFSLFLYLAYCLMLGSRGGVLRLIVIVFVLAVAIYRDPKIKADSLISTAIIVLALSIFTYFAGTEIREMKRASCAGTLFNSDNAGYEADPIFTGKFKEDKRNEIRPTILPSVKKVLDRLGTIDYPIGHVAVRPNDTFKSEYINFQYVLKNIVNNVLIGVPYPEAQLMTSNMFPLLYRNFNMEHVKENFLSEPFTIWGLSFIHFGYFDGLLFLLISSIFLQILYLYISHKSGRFIEGGSYIFKGYFLWMIVLSAYYNSFGFDHSAITFIYGALQFATTFLIIYSIDKLQIFLRR